MAANDWVPWAIGAAVVGGVILFVPGVRNAIQNLIPVGYGQPGLFGGVNIGGGGGIFEGSPPDYTPGYVGPTKPKCPGSGANCSWDCKNAYCWTSTGPKVNKVCVVGPAPTTQSQVNSGCNLARSTFISKNQVSSSTAPKASTSAPKPTTKAPCTSRNRSCGYLKTWQTGPNGGCVCIVTQKAPAPKPKPPAGTCTSAGRSCGFNKVWKTGGTSASHCICAAKPSKCAGLTGATLTACQRAGVARAYNTRSWKW